MTKAKPNRRTEIAAAAKAERRCVLTGEVMPKSGLIRLIAGPDGELGVDLGGRYPGRGAWVSADRARIELGVVRGELAAKAARTLKTGPLRAPADLGARIDAQWQARIAERLGLARRAGQLLAGYEKVEAALKAKQVALLITASDAADDGANKLAALARHTGCPVLRLLDRAQLSLALGRDNVVHAALGRGGSVEKLLEDAAALALYRGVEHGLAMKAGESKDWEIND